MNEPIFDSRLAPTGTQGGGVAAVITPKKRAMAVKVDKVVGVSGFIHPGNRVDVLVTLSHREDQTPITKTVLENVLVLATGAETDKSGNRESLPRWMSSPWRYHPKTVRSSRWRQRREVATGSEKRADTGNVVTKGTTFPVLLGSYSSAGQVSAEEQP